MKKIYEVTKIPVVQHKNCNTSYTRIGKVKLLIKHWSFFFNKKRTFFSFFKKLYDLTITHVFIHRNHNYFVRILATFLNNSTGPENWPGICKTGKKQSPIDIVTENAVRQDLGALKFSRYDFAFSGWVTNTGHSGKTIFRYICIFR